MVQAIQGLLLTCSDESIKQILLHLDSKHNFIIEDIDEKNVFIDPSRYDFVNKEVERILLETMFQRSEM